MTAPLEQAARHDVALRNELLRLYPTLAEDDQALADTLEGESDFDQIARAVVRSALRDEALADGLDALMIDCKTRQLRFQERSQTKRAALLSALEIAGRKRLELPEATVVLRSNPGRVIITDEDKIPAQYWVPQPATLDKRAVLAALNADIEVPGAEKSNGGTSLQIRKG